MTLLLSELWALTCCRVPSFCSAIFLLSFRLFFVYKKYFLKRYSLELDVFLEGDYDLQGIFEDLEDLLNNVTAYAPNMTMGTDSTEINGIFGVISDFSEFSGALLDFLEIVDLIQDEIPSELMSVLRHASILSPSDTGCQQLSKTFKEYTERELGISDIDNPCDFLPQLKQKLNYSTDLLDQDNVTLQSLVEFSSALEDKISSFLGYDIDIEEAVRMFGMKSARRVMDAAKAFFLNKQGESGGRRLSAPGSYRRTKGDSYAHRSVGVMREVRRTFQDYALPDPHSHHRRLLVGGDKPLISFPLIDNLLELSFDVNFGDGAKQLLFSVDFDFDADPEE